MPHKPGVDPKQEGGAFGPSAKETRQTRRKLDVKPASRKSPASARPPKRPKKKKIPFRGKK